MHVPEALVVLRLLSATRLQGLGGAETVVGEEHDPKALAAQAQAAAEHDVETLGTLPLKSRSRPWLDDGVDAGRR